MLNGILWNLVLLQQRSWYSSGLTPNRIDKYMYTWGRVEKSMKCTTAEETHDALVSRIIQLGNIPFCKSMQSTNDVQVHPQSSQWLLLDRSYITSCSSSNLLVRFTSSFYFLLSSCFNTILSYPCMCLCLSTIDTLNTFAISVNSCNCLSCFNSSDCEVTSNKRTFYS